MNKIFIERDGRKKKKSKRGRPRRRGERNEQRRVNRDKQNEIDREKQEWNKKIKGKKIKRYYVPLVTVIDLKPHIIII